MAHINKKILIHAPVDKVYALARNPEHWNQWWVGLSEPDKLDGKGEVGTTVKLHYKMAGIDFPVTTRVVEDTIDPKEAHARLEVEGPLEGKQDWTYKAKGKDTEVMADIRYTVPGKAIGRLINKVLVEKMTERSAEHTLENLKLICEARA